MSNTPQSQRSWRPRLSEEITEEQFWALKNLIPHGIRKRLFSSLVDNVIEWLSDPATRNDVLYGLVKGTIRLRLEVRNDKSNT